jgi:hypothetical protein
VAVELRGWLSVPPWKPTAASLADESVSVFRLWYLVDVHHLDRPLLFGCAKSKHEEKEKVNKHEEN